MDSLLRIEDVMELLKVGRATATRIIKESRCALPRVKGQKYLVKTEPFLKYVGLKD